MSIEAKGTGTISIPRGVGETPEADGHVVIIRIPPTARLEGVAQEVPCKSNKEEI